MPEEADQPGQGTSLQRLPQAPLLLLVRAHGKQWSLCLLKGPPGIFEAGHLVAYRHVRPH